MARLHPRARPTLAWPSFPTSASAALEPEPRHPRGVPILLGVDPARPPLRPGTFGALSFPRRGPDAPRAALTEDHGALTVHRLLASARTLLPGFSRSRPQPEPANQKPVAGTGTIQARGACVCVCVCALGGKPGAGLGLAGRC